MVQEIKEGFNFYQYFSGLGGGLSVLMVYIAFGKQIVGFLAGKAKALVLADIEKEEKENPTAKESAIKELKEDFEKEIEQLNKSLKEKFETDLKNAIELIKKDAQLNSSGCSNIQTKISNLENRFEKALDWNKELQADGKEIGERVSKLEAKIQ